MLIRYPAFIAAMTLVTAAHANITIALNAVDATGTGAAAGRVLVSQSPYGLVFTPDLNGLPPGPKPKPLPPERNGAAYWLVTDPLTTFAGPPKDTVRMPVAWVVLPSVKPSKLTSVDPVAATPLRGL